MFEDTICDVSSIVKYDIPTKNGSTKLIIIGESHILESQSCEIHESKRLSGFISYHMNRDTDVKLLMEYPPERKLCDINYISKNMRDIRDNLCNRSLDYRVEGIDTRRQYIDSDLLYNKEIYLLTYKKFLQKMWEPIVKNRVFDVTQEKHLYSERDYQILLEFSEMRKSQIDYFYKFIKKNILPIINIPIKKNILIIENNVDVVKYMRQLWAYVVDKNILEIVLRNGSKKLLILVGYKHAHHLFDILGDFKVTSEFSGTCQCARVDSSLLTI